MSPPVKCDLSENLTEKLKEILSNNGITEEVSEILVDDSAEKGQGMVSESQCVKVKFADSRKKDLNLFLKLHTSNPSHTAMIEELKAFEKEAIFLTKYVPAAKELCKRNGMGEFVNFYPNCLFGDDKMIVLKNLVLEEGFEIPNCNGGALQDLETATYGIKTLAKHDALSFAMIKECGGAEKFFNRFPHLDNDGAMKPTFLGMSSSGIENALKSNMEILKKYKVEGGTDALKALSSLTFKEVLEMYVNCLKFKADEEELLVLGHGDYWNNNMMIKKEKDPPTSRIMRHVAIDFQMTRYNVPVIELAYYLFLSVDMDVRQTYLHDFLELYLDTFKDVASKLGYPVQMTHEQLFTQFRKKFFFGYWTGFSAALGPGLSVMKDIDVSQIDVNDWANEFGKLVNKWLENHPEEGKRFAESIVKAVREYKELLLE